jgi:hypothetical protein
MKGQRQMTTADCRKYIIANLLAQVDHRLGPSMGLPPAEVQWHARVRQSAATPTKWKRRIKYNVGSKVDIEGSDGIGGGLDFAQQPALHGGVVREFFLDDSDGICFALVEKNSAIVHVEDLCD